MRTSAALAAPPSELEHELLRELAIERFGLELTAKRRTTVARRLAPRLSACRTDSVGAYCRRLRQRAGDDPEWGYLADAVTNSETYFFRGGAQLDAFVALLPALARRRPLRVLSAGCASGEETYSLALVLAAHADALPASHEVIGVDVATPRLDQARAGRYRRRSFKPAQAVPPGVDLDRHLVRDGDARVPGPALRAHVRFRAGNLADPDGLGLGRFDVVFCRNVLIYAHRAGWPRFLRTLADALEPDGYLFLGQTESLVGRDSPFAARRVGGSFAYVHAACRSGS